MNFYLRWGIALIIVHGLLQGTLRAQEPAISNLSVRARIGTETPLVVGFTIAPGPNKTVMVRAVGPTLVTFGVKDAIVDPKLALYGADGRKLIENDNSSAADSMVASSVGAFPLIAGGKDAQLVTTLPAGSYTVHATGVGSAVGIALVEVYDVSGGSNRLSNLSSLAQLDASENVVISGFTVSPGLGTRRVLFRAVGSAIRNMGRVADPKLEIFAGPNKIAENDNWAATAGNATEFFAMSEAFAASGAFPLPFGSSDSALIKDLPAGTYTMHVRASDNLGGAVLVEAYETPSDFDLGGTKLAANLEIRDFRVRSQFDGYFQQYFGELTFAETNGKSAALVESVRLQLDDGEVHTWYVRMPVAPGDRVVAASPSTTNYQLDDFLFLEGLGIIGMAKSAQVTVTYRISDGSERVVQAVVKPTVVNAPR